MARRATEEVSWSAVIVDDERPARRRIEELLSRDTEISVVGSTDDPDVALSVIAERDPDLLFVDVDMPRMSGVEFVRRVPPESLPLVIFVTAYDDYAVSAFDLNAVDYVLKPVDAGRFATAVERAKQQLRAADGSVRSAAVRRLLGDRSGVRLDRIVVEANQRMRLLRIEDVESVHAAGNYVSIRACGREYLLRETIASVEAKLDPARFVRIHRSTLVNVDLIVELVPRAFGECVVVMRNGEQLQMSRRYRSRLEPIVGRL